MTLDKLMATAREFGFENVAPLDVSTIQLQQEVRDMCAVNTCGKYGTCWSCPPGCGTLEECGRDLERYTHGILVQSIGNIEDGFDYEAIMETEDLHRRRFMAMRERLGQIGVGVLALGAGTCRVCDKCTYPHAPCRFPEKQVSSMEAYGMLVLEVCKANGVQYYYGAEKIAFVGCFLL